ncbi:hypothetical protein QN277_006425 [Acacia crassicarpa]|uniref:RIN4 pathogenic type III effector avirulence factor Avr cleavage site domain-containing protein n=1 Tax=Acacia crassicarpa TaxID=499986 RepID=A0AAE1ISZ7_9FABA|nr:hypothetical protein QN277_006425 [Acacia crassicarpa]
MDDRKEKTAPWLSVPQFGDWDQKDGQVPDYSLDFSKIRETRKQNKTNLSRASLGNEEELMATNTASINTGHSEPEQPHYHQNHEPPTEGHPELLQLLCESMICKGRCTDLLKIVSGDNCARTPLKETYLSI